MSVERMDSVKRVLEGLLLVLFIEAIVFSPWIAVFVIAPMIIKGKVLLIALDSWQYTVSFLMALFPYIILKITKPKIKSSRFNMTVMVLILLTGICFLMFFSFLVLVSCAGHPPYGKLRLSDL